MHRRFPLFSMLGEVAYFSVTSPPFVQGEMEDTPSK
jgi:hypothetical protein